MLAATREPPAARRPRRLRGFMVMLFLLASVQRSVRYLGAKILAFMRPASLKRGQSFVRGGREVLCQSRTWRDLPRVLFSRRFVGDARAQAEDINHGKASEGGFQLLMCLVASFASRNSIPR